MKITEQIAKHVREVHCGGNWTVSCLKEQLADVSWQHAVTQIQSFHTIAELVYHIHYFVDAGLQVLRDGVLDAHDKYSFTAPPIHSQQDWENLLEKVWEDAETFASLVERMPESRLSEIFVEEKYGNYYRNLHCIIEHSHYHLGQIALIKNLVRCKHQASL